MELQSTLCKDTPSGWYLVFTKPRHENIAKINLQRQGFHTYCPVLQQHKRQRNVYQIVTDPLFPRYLFIQLNTGVDDWSKIRSTRGCVSLVRFGTLAARVPDALIEQLKRDESMRFVKPKPDFKPGDRVRVLAGVLAGYEGIVDVKNSQQRVTLLLTFAEGHTRQITLPVQQIKIAY
jgi:transcriptional antiterminator RfaH